LGDFLTKVTDPELAKLDGLTAGTATASKVLILGANKNVDVIAVADLKLGADAGTSVTSTAAELNILHGATLDVNELNLLDGSVVGTAVASKVLSLGTDKNVDVLAIADLKLGSGAGTSVTATAGEINTLASSGISNADLVKLHAVTASKDEINTLTSSGVSNADLVKLHAVTADYSELNLIDGSVAGTAVASKALVLGASKNVDELLITNLKLTTGSPVNAVNAYATLTFTGSVSDTETITIGADVYEFDTGGGVTEGHIAVDVSGGATAPAAVTALVSAITASATEPVSAVDGEGDTVVVTADVAGITAESILVSKSCTNASWGADTHLENGVDGTVIAGEGIWFKDSSYIYYATTANTVADKNWRRIALGSAY